MTEEVNPTICVEIQFDSNEELEDVETVQGVYGKATRSMHMPSGKRFTRYGKF